MATRRTPDLPPVTISEAGGVRYLHLGSIWVQGAMEIGRPQRVHLEYVQRMLASLLWLPSERLAPPLPAGRPRRGRPTGQPTDGGGEGGGRAVQLGLGAGAITRFTRCQLRWPTTVVELNPMVVDACRAWFHLSDDDPQLEIVRMEAGAWLARQAEPGSALLLHVDLYDHEAAAPVLDSESFYADCRALLADGGVMSVNLFGRDASFADSAARIAAVFGAQQVWSLRPTREGNTVVVAGRDVAVPSREELVQRAATIESLYAGCGLPARKWLRMVRPWASATDARPAAPSTA